MSRHPIAVANASIPGASARWRMYWPGDYGSTGATDEAKYGPNPVRGVGGFGGAQAVANYGGAQCIDQPCAAGSSQGQFCSSRLSWFTERAGGTVTDEFSCASIRLTAAFIVTAPVLQDLGCVIACGTLNKTIVHDNNAGVEFGPVNAQAVAFRAVQIHGGPLTVNFAVPAALTPDLTKYNTFELRVVSGSANSDPVAFGLINGQVATPRFAWTAAAGLLPPPANGNGGAPAYYMGALNAANGLCPHMYIHEVCWTAAGSESGLN